MMLWMFLFPQVYKCVIPFLSGTAHKHHAPATIIDEHPSLYAFETELHDHYSTLYNHDLIRQNEESFPRVVQRG